MDFKTRTIIVLLFSFLPFVGWGQTFFVADSLYEKGKYAEAADRYFDLYQQGETSQAALLKMAFVQEGTGNPSKALFFLNQYFLLSEDFKAYEKIQELASVNGLKGWEMTDFEKFAMLINNRLPLISTVLLVFCLFMLSLMFFLNKRGKVAARRVAGFITLFIVFQLFAIINLVAPEQKAVVRQSTFLLEGPSAASQVVSRLSPGHQVEIAKATDVWLAVHWAGRQGYIKQSDLLVSQ